ncbi:uncharacterized protein LOC111793026 isoform X1 [Cucurbita pepo subsp. pepo]|uniref:uncharacterized protein LOC111793026 isoform X1 n=1 Tax=Cucurbita pepo subsp. pepo TaxID=3664 RepID=UPI000C9D41F2|nr:uncharacterized protein LOC111793026 isoform X1 [Cucurbita pepo subsp. pepo]
MAEGPEAIPSSSQPSSALKWQDDNLERTQVPKFSSFPTVPNGGVQMIPIMYPALVPGSAPLDNQNRGAGIYAVPAFPSMGGPVIGMSTNNLIPLTYSIPTRSHSSNRTSSEGGTAAEENGRVEGQQQPQQQQPAPQRQVVRRFQIAIQIDLLLILKLAAVIFLVHQDGSRQRLIVLVICASIVYLYQTGALTPFIRWLSQGMQRAAAPPHPPRPGVRAENAPVAPPAAGQEAAIAAVAFAEGRAGAEGENQPGNEENRAVENENVAEPGAANGGLNWWGVVKEIQMIVFGFITSLLPGFHNHMD